MATRTLTWIEGYFSRIEHYSLSRFIIELSFIALIGKVIVGALLSFLIPSLHPTDIPETLDLPLIPLLFVSILLMPVLETLLFQCLPITLVKFFTARETTGIVVSSALFSFAHGYPDFLIIVPGALVFAYAFVVRSRTSIWTAIGVTTILHTVHNMAALLLYYSLS